MRKQLMKGNEAIVQQRHPGRMPRHSMAIRSRRPARLPRQRRSTCPRRAESFCRPRARWRPSTCSTARRPRACACMTASSGPGISLMQEGISYMAGAELPCVIADITRGGPGLGNIGAGAGRLSPGGEGRRQRQLSHHRAGAALRAGDGRPDRAGLRAGGPLSQSGGGAGGRICRADDGAGGVSANGRCAAAAGLGRGRHRAVARQPDHFAAHGTRRPGSARAQTRGQVSNAPSARRRCAEELHAEDAEIVLVGYGIVAAS